ncbi:hypothetical protein D3C77_112130 [compost metagenome]
MKKFSAFVFFTLFSVSALAGPNISVGTFFDYLDGDKSTYLKRVFNGGDNTAFVRVNIYEIVYDANGKSQELPVEEKGAAATPEGLIASPARMIVPSQGMQGTRLLYMGKRDKERYYRVRFVPVVPEQDDQFAMTEEEREAYKASMSAGVNVLTAYGIMFFVRPLDSRYDTKIENTSTHYKVTNGGNTTIVLDEFKSCVVKKPQECHPTRKHHVLPGKTFSFDKEANREYTFDLIEGGAPKRVKVAKR